MQTRMAAIHLYRSMLLSHSSNCDFPSFVPNLYPRFMNRSDVQRP